MVLKHQLQNILPLGINEDQVYLRPYTFMWKWLYQIEKLRLYISLNGYIYDIQHVGSTSIPNISSKPIIDICIAVSDLRKSMLYVSHIEKLGYQYKGENAVIKQHSFVKGHPTFVHLYMVEKGNRILVNGKQFRDYLIKHPDVALKYNALKLRLAMRYPNDRRQYQIEKQYFVDQILESVTGESLHE